MELPVAGSILLPISFAYSFAVYPAGLIGCFFSPDPAFCYTCALVLLLFPVFLVVFLSVLLWWLD